MITTVCYNQEEKWESREEAMEYFLEGMRNSEGSERERYTNIYFDLMDGKDYCTDERW